MSAGLPEHPDDVVIVDVWCLRGGECWTWSGVRRAAAERLMARTRATMPDARFDVRLVRGAKEGGR